MGKKKEGGLFDDTGVFDSVTDMEPVQEGKYALRIASAEEHTSQAGKPSIHMTLESLGEANAWPVHQYCALPTDDEYMAFKQKAENDDARKANTKLSMLRQFMQSFDLPLSEGFAPDVWPSWIGAECDALLVVEEGYTGGAPRNTVRKFL